MIKFIKWFFSESKKPIMCENVDIYERLIDLEQKYNSLLFDVARLEEENIETTNCLYEINNSIDGIDARIDILTTEKWIDKNKD